MKFGAYLIAASLLSLGGVQTIAAQAPAATSPVVTPAPCKNSARDIAPMMHKAIVARNADAVVALLSDRVDPQTIYPWGERVVGKAAHRAWHQEWFKEQGWSFASIDEISFRERRDTATAVYRIDYRKPNRPPLIYYFTYLLERENGAWRIMFMQGSPVDS